MPRGIHPQTVQGLFTTPQPDLILHGEAVSPKEWLEQGGAADHIVALAREIAAGH